PGNQNGALRSSVASVRGKTDRNDPPGILGPSTVLDSGRFAEQTPTLPGLFQSTTCALGLGRKAARSGGSAHAIKIRCISVAATLSRPLSHAHCCMISGIRQGQVSATAVVVGLKHNRIKVNASRKTPNVVRIKCRNDFMTRF